MDTKKIDLAIKIISLIAVSFLIYTILKKFGIVGKKTTEQKIKEANVEFNKNIKKTIKSFVDTKKMTISKADFKKYFNSFKIAWENGQVDLLIKYMNQIKNPYDFGYLVEKSLKNGVDIYQYSDKWTSENKYKYEEFMKSIIMPRIIDFKKAITKDLGKYGDIIIKLL